MDPQNLFHTPTTYRLIRLEYLGFLLVAAGFAARAPRTRSGGPSSWACSSTST